MEGQMENTPFGFPGGAETEILRIAGGATKLALVYGQDRDAVASVQSGELAVLAIKQRQSALVMMICSVGEHQWPLTKDSSAFRLGSRRFLFQLPGFVYGLTLPDLCSADELKKFEQISKVSCSYQNHAGIEESEFCYKEPDKEFWAWVYSSINELTGDATEYVPVDTGSETLAESKTTGGDHNMKLQRALRVSAATKLVAKILLKDVVEPGLHVNVVGPTMPEVVVPASIWAISDVVDAVELAHGIEVGRRGLSSTQRTPQPEDAAYWYFNLAGLTLILRAVSAVGARAKANGGGSGEGSSSSARDGCQIPAAP